MPVQSFESDQAAQLSVAVDCPAALLLPLTRLQVDEVIERMRGKVIRHPVAKPLDPGPHARQCFKRKWRSDRNFHVCLSPLLPLGPMGERDAGAGGDFVVRTGEHDEEYRTLAGRRDLE